MSSVGLPAASRRCSATRIPAAGQPLAVSSTCVVELAHPVLCRAPRSGSRNSLSWTQKCIHFVAQCKPDAAVPRPSATASSSTAMRPAPRLKVIGRTRTPGARRRGRRELDPAHRRFHHRSDRRASARPRHQARRAEDRRHLQGFAHHRAPGADAAQPRQAGHARAGARRPRRRAERRGGAPGVRGAPPARRRDGATRRERALAAADRRAARPPARRGSGAAPHRRARADAPACRLPRRPRAHARQPGPGRDARRAGVALLADRADVPVGAFGRALLRGACRDRRRAREARRARGREADAGATCIHVERNLRLDPRVARPRGGARAAPTPDETRP